MKLFFKCLVRLPIRTNHAKQKRGCVQAVLTNISDLKCARQGLLFFEIEQRLLAGAQTLLRNHQPRFELAHTDFIALASLTYPGLRRTQQSDVPVVENAAVSRSIT